ICFRNHVSRFRKSHRQGLLLLTGPLVLNCLPATSSLSAQGLGVFDLSPILDGVAAPHYSVDSITPKPFRVIVTSVPNPPLFSPTLSLAKWKFFWRINIHHSTRNIWFRALHDKLSSSQRLNQILPVVFPSPLCRICLLSTDTAVHFLYLCPQKWLVWIVVWQRFLGMNLILLTWNVSSTPSHSSALSRLPPFVTNR
ncbi:hypothetical protein CLU79DRAFT_783318, partial [Phycomyces nitens]